MSYHVNFVRTRGALTVPIELAEAKKVLAEAGWNFQDAEGCFVLPEPEGNNSTFWFKSGQLWAASPSEQELQRMLDVAPALEARIRGDEFETYRTINDWFVHPDDGAAVAQANELGKFRKVSLISRNWIARVAGATVVGLLAYAVSRLGHSNT